MVSSNCLSAYIDDSFIEVGLVEDIAQKPLHLGKRKLKLPESFVSFILARVKLKDLARSVKFTPGLSI